MEREKAEAKKSLDEFKDSFFKATGKELTLLNEEEVRWFPFSLFLSPSAKSNLKSKEL